MNSPSVDEIKVFVPPREAPEPAFAENCVPVFFGCDMNFFNHAITSIASVMEHASAENNYDFIVVQQGVPQEKMAAAAAWIRKYPNASLRFVDISVKVAMVNGGAFHVTRAYNLSVYYRIFAPNVFSKYDKIIYLDSDIIVLSDIAGFYNSDLKGNLILACHDFASEHQSLHDPKLAAYWREELGLEPGDSYFQSGCTVMDLKGMRKAGTERTFIEKIKSTKGGDLPDQDIMNAVLKGRTRFIDCEWNYLDWMSDPDEDSPNYQYVSPEAVEEIRRNRPRYKVLHYAEKKPWTTDYMGKNAEHYWRHAALTPFYDDSMARLAAQIAPFRSTWRYLRFSLQLANLRLRRLFSFKSVSAKYASRMENIRRRRAGIFPQARRVADWRRVHGKG